MQNNTRSRSRFRLQFKLALRIAISSVLGVVMAAQVSVANNRTSIQMKTLARISPQGDANINVDFEMPAQEYSAVKKLSGNANYFARQMSSTLAWSEIRDLKGTFVDEDATVNASLTFVGYAKPYAEGKWAIDMSNEGIALVSIDGNMVHFSSSTNSEMGALKMEFRIKLPGGCEDVKFDERKKRLTYRYTPTYFEGKNGQADFELDCKTEIMSSLAKIYGDEQFDNCWVARAKFENTGDQLIRDFRVRFRISNLSSWSSWKRTKVVYPGQTVIDPFFPVLDIEQLGKITDTRTAMVEVEYQYVIDGDKTQDTDSEKIKVLSRNEVLWGSRPLDELLNWYEGFDNAQSIGAAFANSNDPVIQQVAGVVTRMAGSHSQASDEGAVHFLKTFWTFMELNKISYQSPAGDQFDGHLSQHVKYGRDVIRNRAGTCVDLAILWAAVSKAVGLKAHIVFVPGHAFPVIELPSGKMVPIESTAIIHNSFEDAVKKGQVNLAIAQGQITKDGEGKAIPTAGMIIWCNVNEMHNAGVYCLDLPSVEDGYLLKLGYKIELPEGSNRSRRQQKSGGSETQNFHPSSLLGVWRCEVQADGGTLYMAVGLYKDGSYEIVSETYDYNQNLVAEYEDEGEWAAKDGDLAMKSPKDGISKYRYVFKNGYLMVTFDGNELAFKKDR